MLAAASGRDDIHALGKGGHLAIQGTKQGKDRVRLAADRLSL